MMCRHLAPPIFLVDPRNPLQQVDSRYVTKRSSHSISFEKWTSMGWAGIFSRPLMGPVEHGLKNSYCRARLHSDPCPSLV
uniref:Uncharacterized protein n=1 Tax=Romanomermis culicivorax TaxID=13658 RepID=A0A915KCN5_ROMCU